MSLQKELHTKHVSYLLKRWTQDYRNPATAASSNTYSSTNLITRTQILSDDEIVVC